MVPPLYPPEFRASLPEYNGSLWTQTEQSWLDDRIKVDNIGEYWRIHDNLYDLTSFIKTHPGGEEWITRTRGTDVTELFETMHVLPLAEMILSRYSVGPIDNPRNSLSTFEADGFYRVLKTKVAEVYRNLPRGPSRLSKATFDLLLGATLLACLAGRPIPGGVACGLLSVSSHSFLHLRDEWRTVSGGWKRNWRRYGADLSLTGHRARRVAHVVSHHAYPNTELDLEMTLHMRPLELALPSRKTLQPRLIVALKAAVGLLLAPAAAIVSTVTRLRRGWAGQELGRPLWERLMPLAPGLLLGIHTVVQVLAAGHRRYTVAIATRSTPPCPVLHDASKAVASMLPELHRLAGTTATAVGQAAAATADAVSSAAPTVVSHTQSALAALGGACGGALDAVHKAAVSLASSAAGDNTAAVVDSYASALRDTMASTTEWAAGIISREATSAATATASAYHAASSATVDAVKTSAPHAMDAVAAAAKATWATVSDVSHHAAGLVKEAPLVGDALRPLVDGVVGATSSLVRTATATLSPAAPLTRWDKASLLARCVAEDARASWRGAAVGLVVGLVAFHLAANATHALLLLTAGSHTTDCFHAGDAPRVTAKLADAPAGPYSSGGPDAGGAEAALLRLRHAVLRVESAMEGADAASHRLASLASDSEAPTPARPRVTAPADGGAAAGEAAHLAPPGGDAGAATGEAAARRAPGGAADDDGHDPSVQEAAAAPTPQATKGVADDDAASVASEDTEPGIPPQVSTVDSLDDAAAADSPRPPVPRGRGVGGATDSPPSVPPSGSDDVHSGGAMSGSAFDVLERDPTGSPRSHVSRNGSTPPSQPRGAADVALWRAPHAPFPPPAGSPMSPSASARPAAPSLEALLYESAPPALRDAFGPLAALVVTDPVTSVRVARLVDDGGVVRYEMYAPPGAGGGPVLPAAGQDFGLLVLDTVRSRGGLDNACVHVDSAAPASTIWERALRAARIAYTTAAQMVSCATYGHNVAHHLFPTIDPVHLPTIHRIIVETAEEFGVPTAHLRRSTLGTITSTAAQLTRQTPAAARVAIASAGAAQHSYTAAP